MLARSLEGADVLYNTYWVRFPRGPITFERAVENSRTLIRAAVEAGVGRVVHVSITNASPNSDLPYFRGKGVVEASLVGSGLPYAIIRPTVIFGEGDLLINNIAWFLRRFPLFTVFGSGQYKVQPVSVHDVARLAADAGMDSGSTAINAAGPEIFKYSDLVRTIAAALGVRARLVHVPPAVALWLTRPVGFLTRDVVVTRDEIAGLSRGLLVSDQAPTGEVRFSDWLTEHRSDLGVRYESELRRHYR